MKISSLLTPFTVQVAAGLAVIGVGYYIFRKLGSSVGDAAAAVGTAVNPTSDKNLAYRATNAVGTALSGDQSWSLGSWLYDLSHDNYDPNQPLQRSAQKLANASDNLDSIRGDDSITYAQSARSNVS